MAREGSVWLLTAILGLFAVLSSGFCFAPSLDVCGGLLASTLLLSSLPGLVLNGRLLFEAPPAFAGPEPDLPDHPPET
ncbi:MAG: hypothetical protein HY724_11870 [Candidatus Rokubacteria bacterium]|nr:hypothetical protein [Candidatus Rokubacteria bacterium]